MPFGPLFTTDSISPLPTSAFLEKLHLLLHALGYPQRRFNRNYLQIWAAATAANAGIKSNLRQ
ncbi:hypothetical protein CHS0354_027099, partial [Potamilus streckersoni]